MTKTQISVKTLTHTGLYVMFHREVWYRLTCDGRSWYRFDHQVCHICSGKRTFCAGIKRCQDHKLLSYCREKERNSAMGVIETLGKLCPLIPKHYCSFSYSMIIMIACVSAPIGLKVIMQDQEA